VAILTVGAVLMAAAVAEVFDGMKAEAVSDLVRTEMTDEGLARHRADFESGRQAVVGLQADVLPAVAAGLRMTPGQLRAKIDVDYPSTARLLAREAEIVPFAESSIANLERQQERFEHADAMPVSWLPAYASGVITGVLAAVLMVAGVALVRGIGPAPGRVMAVPAAVAAVLILLPLSLGYPGKAADAEAVLDSLNPSRAVVQRTVDSIAVARAADTEFRVELAPNLAASLGMTDAQFAEAIAEESPATAAALTELPDVLARYDARLAIRVDAADDVRFFKRLPMAALGWFGPVFGGVLAVLTGGAAWATQRKGARR
jgi:hypothetical protein